MYGVVYTRKLGNPCIILRLNKPLRNSSMAYTTRWYLISLLFVGT